MDLSSDRGSSPCFPATRRTFLLVALSAAFAATSLVPVVAHSAEATAWSSLTPAQKQALAPLEHEWEALPENRRVKWRAMADRFSSMTPTEQQRVQERMARWARMSAMQRDHARQNYQQLRKVPPQERQEKWEAYQKLSPQERKALASRAKQHNRSVAPDQSGKQAGAAMARPPSPVSGTSAPVHATSSPNEKGHQ